MRKVVVVVVLVLLLSTPHFIPKAPLCLRAIPLHGGAIQRVPPLYILGPSKYRQRIERIVIVIRLHLFSDSYSDFYCFPVNALPIDKCPQALLVGMTLLYAAAFEIMTFGSSILKRSRKCSFVMWTGLSAFSDF